MAYPPHTPFVRLCLLLSFSQFAFGAALPMKRADAQVTGRGTVYTGTQADNQDVFLGMTLLPMLCAIPHNSSGVPYAQPPTGDLRFRKPVAVTPGPTVNAQNFGPRCLQWFPTNDASEDCLTLNIWRPRDVTGLLPVMIWICEFPSSLA